MTRIGLTGAKGFIGRNLLLHLAAADEGQLRLLVRTSSLALEGRLPETAEVVRGDLASLRVCEQFVADLDVIVHLAHCNSPATSESDLPGDARQNLAPLLNLLQAIRSAGTHPHVVYFSSGGAVYAPREDRVPYRETDECAPVSSYGIQKLAAEHYLRTAAAKGVLTGTVLRVGNAYGDLLPATRMQGLIGVAIRTLLEQRPVKLFGSLHNVRDYVHVDDVCRACCRVLRLPGPFDVYNVGTGVGHSVRQVLALIEERFGPAARYETADEALEVDGLPEWSVLDVAKARCQLGWEAEIALRDGIGEMIERQRSGLKAG